MRVVTDELYGDHLRGIGHPESPDRVEVVAARLRERGLLAQTIRPRDAADAELERVHTRAYIELTKREIAALCHPERAEGAVEGRYLSTGDVVVDARSLDVARRAAGGAIAALEAASDSGKPTFALVRPPGHHAESARGMGFCLFNNAAVAARAFQATHGGRVLVVDFDYHHGNGTQDIVGNGLSYVSTHAYPAYPGTGVESRVFGNDVLVNVPLPVTGISTEAFVAVWEWLLEATARYVKPDAIVVSAGFDYVKGDPVGDLGVDVDAAAALASAINRVAATFCGGRVAYVLEGGYDIGALTESIALVLEAPAQGGERSAAVMASIPAEQRALLAKLGGFLGCSGGE